MPYKKQISSIELNSHLVKRFLGKDKAAQNDLHALLDRLIEKGLRALEFKGSFFHDRSNTKQEIIVAVLMSNDSAILRNFKGDSRLSTYLWSIIRFKLIDKLRQELLSARRTEPLPDDISHQENDTARELRDLIDRFLDESSALDKFILQMRWLEGMNYADICRAGAERGMEMTASYIGNLLFRKRNNLLQYLKKHGYDIDKLIRKRRATEPAKGKFRDEHQH